MRSLRQFVGTEICDLNAVVTVSDDGGSSGRLRRDFGVLPPGDIRNCIAALADDEDLLVRLFQYRFAGGEGLAGHSFGNLLLTALTGITGSFYDAILTAESILSVRGKILPATLSDVRLRARGTSGEIYEGESAIGHAAEGIEQMILEPPSPPPFPQAMSALRGADLVIVGPGSLYTSLLPNLLIPGIRDLLRERKIPIVLVMNLMTQPGETEEMMAVDHVQAILEHTGPGLVDTVLVNNAPLPDELLAYYRDAGSEPVRWNKESLESLGMRVVEANLLADGEFVRHDPEKLSAAILKFLSGAPCGEVNLF